VLSFRRSLRCGDEACFGVVACVGLIASFHTIIYAYGRQIYSLSRAGYFPQWLSVTHARHKTPVRALMAGSLLGLAAALGDLWVRPEQPSGRDLLNMAVFGAVIAYILQMASFLLLRRNLPSIERPYVSPFGVVGAVLATVISAVTLVVLFQIPITTKACGEPRCGLGWALRISLVCAEASGIVA